MDQPYQTEKRISELNSSRVQNDVKLGQNNVDSKLDELNKVKQVNEERYRDILDKVRQPYTAEH